MTIARMDDDGDGVIGVTPIDTPIQTHKHRHTVCRICLTLQYTCNICDIQSGS